MHQWQTGQIALFWGLALLAALCGGCGAAPDIAPGCGAPAGGAAVASILAVGDTGQPRPALGLLDTQMSVARALAAEHAARPVDALLILGDIFYPHGLVRNELVSRVRDNIVEPYCAFLALAGARSDEVESACGIPPERRSPVPLYAVLGNHDYDAAESPTLQRTGIPELVSSFHMPPGVAESVELEGGVSLILIDSVALVRGAHRRALTRALRESRGPWRIVAAHHPLLAGGYFWDQNYVEKIAQAAAEAGVRIDLLLAGHEHDLQIARPERADLPFQVVAGSGSSVRSSNWEVLGRVFGLAAAGFARVDVVETRRRVETGEEVETRLVTTLFATRRYPFQLWESTRAVACWSVDAEGNAMDVMER